MIVVHDIFICKPGNASKLAKIFKETMGSRDEVTNILSDVTGSYNKVVIISQYETLAQYEESFDKYMNPTPEMKESMEKMRGYTEMYLTGSREIYRTW